MRENSQKMTVQQNARANSSGVLLFFNAISCIKRGGKYIISPS